MTSIIICIGCRWKGFGSGAVAEEEDKKVRTTKQGEQQGQRKEKKLSHSSENVPTVALG